MNVILPLGSAVHAEKACNEQGTKCVVQKSVKKPASQSDNKHRWKELQRLTWALKGSRMDGWCEGNFVIRNVLHGLLQTFQGQYYIVMVHILSKRIEREAKSINGRQVE